MKTSCLFLPTLLVLTFAASRCEAQVSVQLPTIERFGVSTTVVVPDRGSVYLGGVNRSSLGQNSFGTPLGGATPGFGNRGYGRASSAGGISMSATIIDNNEIDRALLAEAARRRGAAFDIYGRSVADAPPLSPAVVGTRESHLRTHRSYLPVDLPKNIPTGRNSVGSSLAETYLRRGQVAEADGQLQAAKIFYRKVAKHGNVAQQQLADARLTQLEAITKAKASRPITTIRQNR